MNPEELAQLKDVIHGTISESTKVATAEVKEAIDAHSKGDDHRYVKALRDKEKRKGEMWEKVQGNIIFYVCVTALGGVGIAIWNFLKKSVSE